MTRELQLELVHHPEKGKLIPGSGGLRKIRWSLPGRGKSGGLRSIYYWAVSRDQIFMLYIYAKNEQEDLTSDQLKTLRKLLMEVFK